MASRWTLFKQTSFFLSNSELFYLKLTSQSNAKKKKKSKEIKFFQKSEIDRICADFLVESTQEPRLSVGGASCRTSPPRWCVTTCSEPAWKMSCCSSREKDISPTGWTSRFSADYQWGVSPYPSSPEGFPGFFNPPVLPFYFSLPLFFFLPTEAQESQSTAKHCMGGVGAWGLSQSD